MYKSVHMWLREETDDQVVVSLNPFNAHWVGNFSLLFVAKKQNYVTKRGWTFKLAAIAQWICLPGF